MRLSRSGRFDRSSSRLRAWRVLSFQVPAPSSLVGSTNSRRARPSAASSDSAIGPVAELQTPSSPTRAWAPSRWTYPEGGSARALLSKPLCDRCRGTALWRESSCVTRAETVSDHRRGVFGASRQKSASRWPSTWRKPMSSKPPFTLCAPDAHRTGTNFCTRQFLISAT